MRIGEIIETSTTGFVAESFKLHSPPALGSLVKVEVEGRPYAYGVVCRGTTVGLDPGRRPVRRSTGEVYDEAIYREHPELQRVLRTEFAVILVGTAEEERIAQHLPPRPPPLHQSVHECTVEEVRALTASLYYLRLLLTAASEVPVEQLLIAHVRQAWRQRGQDRLWLEQTARELASLLQNDHERLMTILYGIVPQEAERG